MYTATQGEYGGDVEGFGQHQHQHTSTGRRTMGDAQWDISEGTPGGGGARQYRRWLRLFVWFKNPEVRRWGGHASSWSARFERETDWSRTRGVLYLGIEMGISFWGQM